MKIFAITFGTGVVYGIVMADQFGSKWAVFSDKAGPIIGSLMAYEMLTASFLEVGVLDVMLFGLDKVDKSLHFAATCMVALGTAISTFWIISANSWMQTVQGYAVNAAGQYFATDWWAVIFNPSMPYRLAHVLLAAYRTTALVVGGAGPWHLIKDRRNDAMHSDGTSIMFSMAHGCTDWRSSWGDRGLSLCWPGGRRPKSGGCPIRSMACSGPRRMRRHWRHRRFLRRCWSSLLSIFRFPVQGHTPPSS